MAEHIIVVIAFDSLHGAEEVYKHIEKAEKDKIVDIDDAVLVTKDEFGKVHHKDVGRHAAKTGAKWGGALGLFIGFGLGGPIGGVAVGAIGGAAVGALGDVYSRLLDAGFSKEQIEAVSEHLQFSSSALLVNYAAGDANYIRKAAEQSGGEVMEFTVATEMGVDVEDNMSAGIERDH